MNKSAITIEAYLKDPIETRTKDVNYTYGRNYGMPDTTFNFMAEPVKEPFGDVAFTTGYDQNPEYTSTFLMSAEEAMELGKMLIDTAYDAMKAKRVLLEAEGCDSRLSFLVLKNAINMITIDRCYDKLENYEPPYYLYEITTYKHDEYENPIEVYKYRVVYNLSYFTKESEIKYWIDRLTDKERVQIKFLNWDPYKELEERKKESQDKIFKSLSKYNMGLKPTPIKK